MIIVIDDSSITNLQHLTGTAKDSATAFLNFLQSAKNLNEISLVFDDVELRSDEDVVYFIRVNEQHVTACIHVQTLKEGTVNVFVKPYF